MIIIFKIPSNLDLSKGENKCPAFHPVGITTIKSLVIWYVL